MLLLLAGLTGGGVYLDSLLPVVTGYAAKYLCSAVFVSGRSQEETEAIDLNFSLVRFTDNQVDTLQKTVTSRFLWSVSTAVYTEGFGAVLVRDAREDLLRSRKLPALPPATGEPDRYPLPDPLADSVRPVPSAELDSLTRRLMKGDYGGTVYSFVVLHNDTLVAEAYKKGISPATPLPGWSLAKISICAMTGMLAERKVLRLDQPAGFPDWNRDERSAITIEDLMRMETGLEWNEDYGNRSDVTRMLYEHGDFAGFTISRNPVASPGKEWNYASGTINVLCRILRERIGNDSVYYTWPYLHFFRPVGMYSALLETDAAGQWAGSSYLFATSRDFARLGLLFLNDGFHRGVRILPKGWNDFCTRPASGSGNSYGAGFWLNRAALLPDAPADLYFGNGYNGQRIFIIPSSRLVIVVLGHSPKPDGEIDFNRLVKDIVACFPREYSTLVQ